MKDCFLKQLKERHGEEIFVISRVDMNAINDFIKQHHPEVHEEMKEKINFDITPVDIKDFDGFVYWME